VNDHGIVDGLGREAYEKCVPLSVSVELTLKCNIRCTHCYNLDRDGAAPADGMGFDDWKRVFGELRDEGTLFLNLTGGEAMVHPRFWDLLDEATRLRFAVTLLTNGTLLTEENCDRLAGYPSLSGVSTSVYGAAPETHDSVTRSRGSWERTVRGAERMRDRGVSVSLKFIVMKANASEVGAMIELAGRAGLPYQVDCTITGRYDGTLGSLATRVERPVLAELYRGPLRGHLSKRKADPTDDEFKCNCARANCGILSSGDVTPCIAVPLPAGNVLREPFGRIWRESPVFRRIRGLRVADFPACAPCPLKAWCRRSPGPPVALGRDFTGIDEWTCAEAAAIKDILA
jgi:radical SAM protein with 4Fe4S-binding SPASM domain